ncbi:MAG: CDP-alcohol phosphatidyltransferase family protein [candidate division Zixibacteria bacterium]|nr:CDP-alcohol phosphatidyltransferase family protein [candidate division Zixibacteria bacterium]
MAVKLINQRFVDGFLTLIQPIVNLLIGLNVHPHAVTVAGLILSIFSGLQFYRGNLVWGGAILVLSGICDVLDGRLARTTNKVSKKGALFDSSIDRYTEVFVFMGLAAYYSPRAGWIVALMIFALGGSLLTSYVRARAEGLGIECKVGIMQRPERLAYLSAGAVFSFIWDGLMIIAVAIVAIFANITAVQRIIHSFKNGGE